MRHIGTAKTVLISAALLTAACRSAEKANGPALVRIGWSAVVGSVPLFIATDREMFKKHNIEAKTIEFSNSNDMVNALATGQIDIIPAISLIPIINLEMQQAGTVRLFSHSRSVPERAS